MAGLNSESYRVDSGQPRENGAPETLENNQNKELLLHFFPVLSTA